MSPVRTRRVRLETYPHHRSAHLDQRLGEIYVTAQDSCELLDFNIT